MEQEERKSAPNPYHEMRDIHSEFLAEVVKLEELVTIGGRFLTSFQQSIEFLRRPSIHEASELVQEVIKANETRRVKSYVEAGCANAYESAQYVNMMNASFSGLCDHLTEAKSIVSKLENLMEKAGSALLDMSENLSEQVEMDFDEDSEIEGMASEAICASHGPAGYASFMAVIYSMMKRDFTMQEKIVSSLSLKSSAGELDSYCLMWSLRPFMDDEIVSKALRQCIPFNKNKINTK